MNSYLAAREAEISMIPINPVTKAPRVPSWRQYQEHLPDLDEIRGWWARGWHDVAVVCGRVSGRLVALDIEVAFMPQLNELATRLKAAGMFGVFESWVAGYCESTPRGGIHVLVRIGGDDPVPQNLKLAFDADGNVLIETRGEGGYCIVAPSHNGDAGWELTHGRLSSIAWATAQEWTAVVAVLASFDESTPPAPPTPPPSPQTPSILRLSESWIDDARASLPPMTSVLADLGFHHPRDDEHGSLWVRPGKDAREGHSVRVNHNGRLMVFSSSLPLPASNRTTYDQVDVILAFELGRAPSSDERTEFLRQLRPAGGTGGGAAGVAADTAPASDSVRLDDAFWQSTGWLKAIRAAAWSRGLAPSGVLGAFLSAFATTVPSGIWVPAVWGSRAPLNTYCCLVGASGSGKTASMHLALDLLGPVANPDVLLGRSLRSGEGLINLATKRPKKGSGGQLDVGEPSYRNAVQIHFDEGSALGRQAERSGATVIPYLNTAWAGTGVVGGAKASEHGSFPADLVRVCCVIGVQFGAAENLFTGESARLGFPQRLLFFGLSDPTLMDHDVDEMSSAPIRALELGELAWSDYTRHPRYIEVPGGIVREIRLWTQNKDHGSGLDDPLDGHLMQLRLRVAALLAIVGGKFAVDEVEWTLSRQIVDYSRRIRGQLLAGLSDVALDKARALGREDVVREEVRYDAWIARRARRIAGFLQSWNDDGATMKELKNRLDSSERPRRDEIVAYAVAKGWIIHRDGRYFPRGEK